MIAHMLSKKKLEPQVADFIIRGVKANVSLGSVILDVPKKFTLKSTDYFTMISKREAQKIMFNYSSLSDLITTI